MSDRAGDEGLPDREKLVTDMDASLLEDVRSLARDEGRPVQALVDEAIAALLVQRRQGRARPHAMAAYRRSHARFSALYDKLAK